MGAAVAGNESLKSLDDTVSRPRNEIIRTVVETVRHNCASLQPSASPIPGGRRDSRVLEGTRPSGGLAIGFDICAFMSAPMARAKELFLISPGQIFFYNF